MYWGGCVWYGLNAGKTAGAFDGPAAVQNSSEPSTARPSSAPLGNVGLTSGGQMKSPRLDGGCCQLDSGYGPP